MKKTLIALLALAAASSAMASSTSTNPFARDIPDPVPVVPSPYTFELGLTTHYESYTEYGLDGSKLMNEKAILGGVKGGVTRKIGDTGGSVVLTGEYAVGKSQYTGSYLGGSYGDVGFNNLGRSLLEVTGMYKQSALWDGLSVGLGLGYRRLVDDLQDAPGGYKRVDDRLYAIALIEQSFKTKNWTITPGLQGDYILTGKAKSDTLGVSVSQHDGYGAQAQVAFLHKGVKVNTVVTPYVRYWNVKDSSVDAATGLYEPRNKTMEGGVNLSFQF